MLSACSITPEQPNYAELISAEQQRVEQWQGLPQQADVVYLNDLVDSKMFDGLVQTAMQSNPSLQQTLLTLQIRQSQLVHVSAEKRPVISSGFSALNSSDGDASFGADIDVTPTELGFGLGLQLTAQLTEKLGGAYQNIANENGHM